MEGAGSFETLVNICHESQSLYCGSFNDTFNSSDDIMLNGKDCWWIMNWKGLKRSCWTLNLGTTPAYTAKDLGESWKHNSG